MIIRHKRFLDVCFEVSDEGSNGVTGWWINMGYTKSWYIERALIQIDNVRDWEKCLDPHIRCLRNARWKSL